ncbi:MAG: alpha-1,2-fucosyltransferase [Dysgonomonas sp.]|nr:alpha-1,2-fucosyltransferase [Dysgonomonas sp.]
MIISRLQGGLGNQMFQYAVARALEKKTDKNIYLDLDFLQQNNISTDSFTARDFELNIFPNLRAKEIKKLPREILLSQRIRYKIVRNYLKPVLKVVEQYGCEFIELPVSRKYSVIYLSGYFQSEKYFSSIRKDLISDFRFPLLDVKNEELKLKILDENSVSIHVRRGDYLKKCSVNVHGVLDLEYYKKAIEYLKEKETSLTFYIFSDDIEYVKNNFNFLSNIKIVDINAGKDSWKDMALMQSCKHHIVANSSFSWWGAWLSERGGINIAPSKWYSEYVNYNIFDFIPNEWEIINLE